MWYVIAGALIVALLVLGPLAVVWSLNTLFGLGIAYGFWEWLAVLVLLFVAKDSTWRDR